MFQGFQECEGLFPLLGAAVIDKVQRLGDGVAIAGEQSLGEFKRQGSTPIRRPRFPA